MFTKLAGEFCIQGFYLIKYFKLKACREYCINVAVSYVLFLYFWFFGYVSLLQTAAQVVSQLCCGLESSNY